MSEPGTAPVMIRHLADEERPREKALNRGIDVLTDAELLAILLRVGMQGKSVITMSREILAAYDNNLARLAQATPHELKRKISGIGLTKAITLTAALELGGRARKAAELLMYADDRMTSSDRLYGYMRDRLERLTHEEFWIVLLSQNLKAIRAERVSIGGVASTLVDVRMLFKKVIDAQAPAIALVHNHPSGALTPSTSDDELTRKICSGATLLDIRVTDHIIVTPSAYYSYHDQGRMP